MNILIVTPWYRPAVGGVVETVANMAAWLAGRDAKVTLLLHGDSDKPQPAGRDGDIEIFSMRLRSPHDHQNSVYSHAVSGLMLLPALWRLRRFIAERRIDVVNVHFPSSQHLYFALLRRRLPFKLVLSVHGSDVRYHTTTGRGSRMVFRRFLMGRADAVVACSQSLLNDALAIGGDLFSGRAEVIYGGVTKNWLAETAPTAESDYLLAVGQLRVIKGFDVLIRAFRAVSRRFPGLRLCLAGEGPLQNGLHELAARLGIEEKVEFKGHLGRSELRDIYRGARMCVIPSFNEGLSLVALEALALGKAVVASRVGGIPELIDSGENGLLVEAGNSRQLADTIMDLLSRPEEALRLGANGRARVLDRFTWEINGRRYRDLFSELTSEPAGRQ